MSKGPHISPADNYGYNELSGLIHICGITSDMKCPKVLQFTPKQGKIYQPTG